MKNGGKYRNWIAETNLMFKIDKSNIQSDDKYISSEGKIIFQI